MKLKSLKIPAIILVIALVLTVVASLLTNIILVPTTTEHAFNYSVTYKLNGETKTLNGVYTCKYVPYSADQSPYDRYYDGEYNVNGESESSHTYTIAEKDGAELYIVTVFNEAYLMNDEKDMDYEPFLEEPYLEAVDKEGYPYDDAEMPGEFTAEIISWEYPEPIENTFVFGGFSALHEASMFAMLAVGMLTIIACLIFVKRDKTITRNVLDKLSVAVNLAVVVLAIPFFTVSGCLLQITMSGAEFIYQVYMCLPAFTAFMVAASIALRRTGFSKTGFFIQFAGPVLFFIPLVLESIFYNIFS